MNQEFDIHATPDFRWAWFGNILMELYDLDKALVESHEQWKKAAEARIDLASRLKDARNDLKIIENGVIDAVRAGDLKGKTKDERAGELSRIVYRNEHVVKARRDVSLLERAMAEAEAAEAQAISLENRVDRRIRWRQQVLGALSTFTGHIAYGEAQLVNVMPAMPQASDPESPTGTWPDPFYGRREVCSPESPAKIIGPSAEIWCPPNERPEEPPTVGDDEIPF